MSFGSTTVQSPSAVGAPSARGTPSATVAHYSDGAPAASGAGGAGGAAIPSATGVGLRAQHHLDVLAHWPDVAWFEAHAENYFPDGGSHVECLSRICERYTVSLHGVGLSLGSTDALSREHLAMLRRAVDRFRPGLVSEHLSWSSVNGRFANDLLPLPYTDEALRHVSARIAQAQDALGRQILIENVSSYVAYRCSTMLEWEFVAGVAAESGCGILLDLNNIFVAAHNHGFSCDEYLEGIPATAVQEFHLAGHTRIDVEGQPLLIDTHGSPVCDAVWALYHRALLRFGPQPTLIEWDTDIPALEVLRAEARTADTMREAAP